MKRRKWIYLLMFPFVTACATAQVSHHPGEPTPKATSFQSNTTDNSNTTQSNSTTQDNSTTAKPAPAKRPAIQANPLGIPEPKAIHGIYVSAPSAGSPKTFASLVHMVDTTSLNSMVIDVKTDNGDVTFATNNPELKPYSAGIIAHPKQMMQTLKQHHIYPIARLAVFEDTRFAKAHPQDSYVLNGHPWIGRQNQAYTNPFLPAVWKYNVDVAKQVAALGFRQIQFDFVRFPAAFPQMESQLKYSMGPYQGKTPTDIQQANRTYQAQIKTYDAKLQSLNKQKTSLKAQLNATHASSHNSTSTTSGTSSHSASLKKQLATISSEIQTLQQHKPVAPHFTNAQRLGGLRVDAVTDFVKYAKKQLQPYDVKVSVDIFGYTATIKESTSVGQNYKRISKHVDVISPMIYPSLWGSRYFGITNPDLHPYQLVTDFEQAQKRTMAGLANPPEQIPWIQDYTATFLGTGHYQVYGTAQVDAQIKALSDSGIHQYLIWNPANIYSKGI